MLLIALAVAPGVAVCLFIFSFNRLGKASMRYLVTAFLLGAAATLPALAVQLLADDVRVEPWRHSILSYIWFAFGAVAFSEEGSKFLVLRYYAYPKKVFREPFDGVIYGVMIGMGFATVENIEYVRQFGLETGVSRFFLAIPAHASFAVLMGYPVGRAKFESRRRTGLLLKGLGTAVLFHGSFDFFLFLQQSREATKYLSTGVLSFGAFATFYIAVRLAMRALRLHQRRQEQGENWTTVNKSIIKSVKMTDKLISIRPAALDDINTIGLLAQQIWPVAYDGIVPADQLKYMLNLFYSPAALRRQMLDEHHQFLLVEQAGEAIGFASWAPLKEPGVFKLHKLYVLPGQQGKGLGRSMLEFIVGAIGPEGARVLRLNVNRFNTARQFYEKLGFRVVGEEDVDIGNNYFMIDYIMEAALTPA